MKKNALIIILLFLSACSTGISLRPYGHDKATPKNFKLCHGFSCSYQTQVKLTDKQWMNATKPLRLNTKSAEQERKNIARAIALMEKNVTETAALNPDLAEATTFEKDQHQMDCIDETINTSLYLQFFEQAGLLKFHSFSLPIHRGYIVDGMWPHNTATVTETATGKIYAMDSYYTGNGGKTYIVEKQEWLNQWRP